jgi:CxxC motif-containing protein
MIKEITCIECPLSCNLSVDIENCRMVKVSGYKCPKGEAYARSEVENPQRFFTATVLCQGMDLKMLPVRTSQPIPKSRVIEAGLEVRKLRINEGVSAQGIIEKNFLGLGVDLVATRATYKMK